MNHETTHPIGEGLSGWPLKSLLGWVLLAAGPLLAWPGGWAVLPAFTSSIAGWWLLQGRAAKHLSLTLAAPESASAPDARASATGRVGAEVMVSEVVPVWARQMEATPDAVSGGLQQLLDSFSHMFGALESFGQTLDSMKIGAEPGAIDQAVRRESGALDTLTAASRRAFDERDAMLAELHRLADAIGELERLGKLTREIGRSTKLVAFNASIEANRQKIGSNDGGSLAVAGELRALATRMAETGERIACVVAQLQGSISGPRRAFAAADTSASELRMEIDVSARAALRALLGSLGNSLSGNESLRDTSRELREQLETAFVNFQFGDRVGQMLSIVGGDMMSFARWVADNPRCTQTDAAQWLTALESSYTMDEQRSTHHGNVHVNRGAGVEFF
jgi:methyl-accepting chemotaxis protein